MICSSEVTKFYRHQSLPVLAALVMASITRSTKSSPIATSILTLGKNQPRILRHDTVRYVLLTTKTLYLGNGNTLNSNIG